MTSDPISLLRAQIAGLLSQIDSAHKPRPTSIVPDGEKLPGPRWEPTERWKVWVITEDEELNQGFVYLTTPQHHALEAPNDFDALTTAEGRLLAMAILSACDHADGLVAGITQLDARRKP